MDLTVFVALHLAVLRVPQTTGCMSKVVATIEGLLPGHVGGKRRPSLMGLGALYRKPLQFEDMWRLPPQDRVANLAQRFETVWEKEQQKAKPSLVSHPIPIPGCWLGKYYHLYGNPYL